MRTRSIFLILFFTANLIHAQTTTGISVQGIARDANKTALPAQNLSFTFTISGTPSNGSSTEYYKETQDITTDGFGVFSHIIGTGTPAGGSGTFVNVPFGVAHMSLKVEVGGVVLLDGPLQYAPYAKNADNGVPVGGVIMWSGAVSDIPAGWALCDGNTGRPDLRGRFILGYNGSTYQIGNTGGQERVTLTIADMPVHNHTASTGNAGSHSHTYEWYEGAGTAQPSGVGGGNVTSRSTGNAGDHTHSVTIDNAGSGQSHENRPPYYVLAYIIRLR